MTPTTRVLRGTDPTPHVFASLDDAFAPSAAPAFVPFPGLAPLAPDVDGAVEGDATTESEPAPVPAPPTFEDGVRAGRAERDGEVAALQAEVARLGAALKAAEAEVASGEALRTETADRLAALWAEAARQMEPALAALAIETAEALLRAPLSPDQRAAADRAIADAVDALSTNGPLIVSLHPVDLLHLQESGLADALATAHPTLRWEPDDARAEGDWTASTSEAAIRRIRTDLIGGLRERLGLPAA